MSRRAIGPGKWVDEGPSGYRPEPRRYMHGALVVGGKSDAPVMGLWKHGLGLTGDDLAKARRIYIGHVGKNR